MTTPKREQPAKPNVAGAAMEYLRELVGQFPDAPALTLAKRAYREHPEMFTSLEDCRLKIRKILGVAGRQTRQKCADKSLYRPPRKAGWSGIVPDSLIQLPDWKPLVIEGPHRALIFGDLHFPFHDRQAIEVALEHAFQEKVTLILLNGDIADHYDLSFFEKNPALRDFPGEVVSVKTFLSGLRKRVGRRTRIVYKQGNHEERYERFMRIKAPELLGLSQFDWRNVFGLADNNIEYVGEKRPIKLNELNVLHGHEYSFAISNPVNPARGLFLRGKTHGLCHHFHQSSNHSEKNLDGKVVSTWSVGCLCELHPAYRPLNNWNHGFAVVELDKGGGFMVENYRIINGKVY